MKTIINSFLAAASLLFVCSCQKKDTVPADPSKVKVTFAAPTANQAYHTGDTVQISADISYVSEIVGVGVQVIDTATGETLYDEDHDLHTDHYILDETWVDTLPESKSLQVKVYVFVAHAAEPAEQWTYFITQP